MPAADPRYGVAQVTEESLNGWRAFCDRHHIDRTALCEVLGLRLGELDRLPPFLERAVRETQELMDQRRRRG